MPLPKWRWVTFSFGVVVVVANAFSHFLVSALFF